MPVERDRDHGERILRARFAELGRPRGQKVSCRGEERVVISLAAARQLEQEAVLGLRELGDFGLVVFLVNQDADRLAPGDDGLSRGARLRSAAAGRSGQRLRE